MAAAESVGVAARVTQTTVEYAKERKQFGRPIGSYQAVSHACAQMFLETEGARSVTSGRPGRSTTTRRTPTWRPTAPRPTPPTRRSTSPRSALQVHGGIGFTWEHDLHLFLKRAEANAHAFGDARWHREQVAGSAVVRGWRGPRAECRGSAGPSCLGVDERTHAARGAGRRAAPLPITPPVALSLQRSAGNAAVARLLAREPAPAAAASRTASG